MTSVMMFVKTKGCPMQSFTIDELLPKKNITELKKILPSLKNASVRPSGLIRSEKIPGIMGCLCLGF